MAFDTYLQIDGIKGESTDSEHKDWIEIISHSSPLTHPVQPAAGGAARAGSVAGAVGGSAGAVAHQPLVITKAIDLASPKLYQAASTGKHIKEVVIEVMRASGDKKVKYMTIKMDQVFISSVVPAGHRGGTTPPPNPTPGNLAKPVTSPLLTESVTFNYGSIQRSYSQQ